MRVRVAVTLLATSAAFAASAHEFECTMEVGHGVPGPDGTPLLDESGAPVWASSPAGALRVDRYPALIAFSVTQTNTAGLESIALDHFDPIDHWIGGPNWSWSWPYLGVPWAPGESVTFGAAVLLESYEMCLALGAHLARGEPTCGPVAENRWGVYHEAGYAECRAQLVCLPQPPPVMPGALPAEEVVL